MKFYSHAKEENGVKKGSKLLKEHLKGVFEKALLMYCPDQNIGIDNQDITDILFDLLYLHDLGKYTTFFQRYLFGEDINQNLKNHSLIGGIYILNKYKDNPFYAGLLYFLVINHHSNFQNILKTGIFVGNIQENNFTINQLRDIENSKHEIEKEIKGLDISSFLKFPGQDIQRNIRKTIKQIIIKNPSIQYYFTINYLFSLLIEADKLDASETPLYIRKALPENAVEKFIGKPELTKLPVIDEINGFEQNKLRNWVRASVLENLKDENILDKNIFTLTAPTGIGKTLTALDFALRLKKRIFEKENFELQIIYGLPFINIIEQALDVYNDVFKDIDIDILGHYQYADVFGKEKRNEGYNQKLMQLNTWQSDIVITSFVQFFETMISNRNKMLLKFNHLAGAIVILDEVQTLRLEQIPLIGAILYYLSEFLNTRIILMTATKPKIFELANKEILLGEGEIARPYELLKDYKKVFKKFNRTKIVPIISKPIVASGDFYSVFISKRTEKQSCLIVCNTVQRSVEIFNELEKNGIAPLYYLSTNIVPAVRLQVIQRIKQNLKNGKNPVLVSTQVVEAGVDLDFDMGFRDLAPIDSIVQVAGRINRENNEKKELSPLYVVDFYKENGGSESAMVYDSLTRDQVLKVLNDKDVIPEKDYLNLIDDYFSNISELEAFNEARDFYQSIKTLKYDGDDFAVSKFRIIKQSQWAISVFIELNDTAVSAREAYNLLLSGKMTKERFDEKFKRSFHQHIIAVPDYLQKVQEIKQMDWVLTENIYYVPFEEVHNFYDNQTGFIRHAQKQETFCLF